MENPKLVFDEFKEDLISLLEFVCWYFDGHTSCIFVEGAQVNVFHLVSFFTHSEFVDSDSILFYGQGFLDKPIKDDVVITSSFHAVDGRSINENLGYYLQDDGVVNCIYTKILSSRINGYLVVDRKEEKNPNSKNSEAMARFAILAASLIDRIVPHNTDGRKVFLGHGNDPIWKDVRDFLKDHWHVDVWNFEKEPHAGEWNAKIVLEMIEKCSFAVIVASKEDELSDKSLQPRLNVIHEIGLSHGAYGLERVFILLEEGAKFLSNLDGLQVVPYEKEKLSDAYIRLLQNLKKHNLLENMKN